MGSGEEGEVKATLAVEAACRDCGLEVDTMLDVIAFYAGDTTGDSLLHVFLHTSAGQMAVEGEMYVLRVFLHRDLREVAFVTAERKMIPIMQEVIQAIVDQYYIRTDPGCPNDGHYWAVKPDAGGEDTESEVVDRAVSRLKAMIIRYAGRSGQRAEVYRRRKKAWKGLVKLGSQEYRLRNYVPVQYGSIDSELWLDFEDEQDGGGWTVGERLSADSGIVLDVLMSSNKIGED